MTSYKYHIYHDRSQSTMSGSSKSELSDAQLTIEYKSIDTELHLYSLYKNFGLFCNTKPCDKGGVVVDFINFKSREEADTFIGQFPEWLKTRINTGFSPVIQRISAQAS